MFVASTPTAQKADPRAKASTSPLTGPIPTWDMDETKEPIFYEVIKDLGLPAVWSSDLQEGPVDPETMALARPVTLPEGVPTNP